MVTDRGTLCNLLQLGKAPKILPKFGVWGSYMIASS